MKRKRKTKPTRPTWPPKPTSSHFPFLPHHTRSLLKGVLIKFTWELYFGNGLHILNTYPHYTGSFGALSEFLLQLYLSWIALHALFFLPRCTRLFFHGSPKWKKRGQQLGSSIFLGAKLLFFRVFFLVFSLEIIFSSFLFS